MIPFLKHPLNDDITDFLNFTHEELLNGSLSMNEYHVALGKALGYVECRFVLDMIDRETATELVYNIKASVFPEKKKSIRKRKEERI